MVLDNNQIKCWGANNVGQLGYDDLVWRGNTAGQMASLGYVDLGIGRTAKKVAAGNNHTCAILDNDNVKCWGFNNSGQLGYDDTATRGSTAGSMALLPYVNVGPGRTVKDLNATSAGTCVILDDGGLKCWGTNSYGQLGQDRTGHIGDNPGEMASLANIDLGAGRTVKNSDVGNGHACATLDNGDVKCWGYNGVGAAGSSFNFQLGSNVGDMALVQKVDLGLDVKAKKVVAGSNHSCALLTTGQIKCWGYGMYGQLGINSSDIYGYYYGSIPTMPTVILGVGRTAVDISAGNHHTCALLDNDTLKCWGLNSNSSFGTDDTVDRGSSAGSMEALLPINYIP